MKVNAIYHQEIEDGRTIHAVDHDGGGFVVSSEVVGIAVQNFLNSASLQDITILHSHLLFASHRAMSELDALDEALS